VVGLIFFELLFPAFQALFSALFLFPSEFKMLLKWVLPLRPHGQGRGVRRGAAT
jgi:hypothetical protein